MVRRSPNRDRWPVASWGVCFTYSSQTWNNAARTYTFPLQARADSDSNSGETAVCRFEDSTGTYSQLFAITIDEPVTVRLLRVELPRDVGRRAHGGRDPVRCPLDGHAGHNRGERWDGALPDRLTLTVPAGQTTATGTVQIFDDCLGGGDQQFGVGILGYPLPAGTPSQAQATIEDDESAPTLSVRPASANEGVRATPMRQPWAISAPNSHFGKSTLTTSMAALVSCRKMWDVELEFSGDMVQRLRRVSSC